jgi:hypothetical protein
MPRYATIITADDGSDVVSAIGIFEGAARPLRSGRVEEVAPGVSIGMVRGGPVDAVGGFGFPNGAQGVGRMMVIAKMARLGEAAPAGAVASAESEAPKPARKPTKARRAKSGKRRKSTGARSRSPKPAVVPAAVPGGCEPAGSHG